MRIPRTIVALLAAFAGAIALAAPAAALEPGVFVDPSSPSGKEYSYPLGVLRGEAVGHAAPDGVNQPLFGVGIAPAGLGLRAAGANSGALTRHSSSPALPTNGKSARARRIRAAAASGARATRHAAPPGGVAFASLTRPRSPAPAVALIAAGVLLGGLALGAGLALARRQRG